MHFGPTDISKSNACRTYSFPKMRWEFMTSLDDITILFIASPLGGHQGTFKSFRPSCFKGKDWNFQKTTSKCLMSKFPIKPDFLFLECLIHPLDIFEGLSASNLTLALLIICWLNYVNNAILIQYFTNPHSKVSTHTHKHTHRPLTEGKSILCAFRYMVTAYLVSP